MVEMSADMLAAKKVALKVDGMGLSKAGMTVYITVVSKEILMVVLLESKKE